MTDAILRCRYETAVRGLPAKGGTPIGRRPEMATLLTVRAILTVAVEVPMARPLGTMRSAPILLIDLETEEGITGHAYLFCYTRMAPGPDRDGAGRHPGRGEANAWRRSIFPLVFGNAIDCLARKASCAAWFGLSRDPNAVKHYRIA